MDYTCNRLLALLITITSFCNTIPNALAEEINLLSYNVYFDDQSGKHRYPNILELIDNEKYNVIALQECTPQFIKLLVRDTHLNKYTMAFGEPSNGYQNILLTSLPVLEYGNIALTTQMGRSAPYIVLSDTQTKIINVHLESGLFDGDVRHKQINEILHASRDSQNLMIAGDFNFGDGAAEALLLDQFNDIGKKRSQITYDTEINILARETKFLFEPSRRLDRIYVKCNACKSSKLDIIKAEYSDHWAINAKIKDH
jgi:endonuclease/exonuclease/phosphatase family metal-dependent hydrolase